MSGKKQLFFGALLSYGVIVFNIVSGLLYTPWMIRVIGSEQYALYVLALSVVNIFLLDFGIGSAVNKFLAKYYSNQEYDRANDFMGIVYKVFMIISIIIASCLTVFYAGIDWIYVALTEAEIVTLKKLFIIVGLYSVLSFPFTTFNGVLMANEKFIEIKMCSLCQKIFNVALIVALLLTGKDVFALVIVNGISNAVFICIKYMLIKKKTVQRVNLKYWDTGLAKNLFSYSVWVTVITLAQRCIFNIMPSLIAALMGSASVTIFSMAAVLEGYVYTFAEAINGMFMPRITRIINSENNSKKLNELVCNVGKYHVYTIGLLFLGFVLIGREFVAAWLGSGYELVYVCSIFLIFPSLIDVPQQVAKTSLLVCDVVKEQAVVFVIMGVLNVVLSFVLIPKMGILGAACSVCVAYLVRTLGLNILYYKNLPIQLVNYYKKTYGRWLVVAAGTGLISSILLGQVSVQGWLSILISGVVIVAIYCVMAILVDSDIRQVLQHICDRVRRKVSRKGN